MKVTRRTVTEFKDYFIKFQIDYDKSSFKLQDSDDDDEVEITDLELFKKFSAILKVFFGDLNGLNFSRISITWSSPSMKKFDVYNCEEKKTIEEDDKKGSIKEFIIKVPKPEAYQILSSIPMGEGITSQTKPNQNNSSSSNNLLNDPIRFKLISHSKSLIDLLSVSNFESWNPGQE